MAGADVSPSSRGWARLVVVLAGGPFTALPSIALIPALPSMAAYFGGSETGEMVAKMVMVVPALMCLLGGPLVGAAAERYGERLCLLLAFFVYGLAGSAGLYVSSVMMLVSSRLLLGIASVTITTISTALITASYSGSLRERLYGYNNALASTTSVIIMAIGGRLVDSVGWRAPFAFYFIAAPYFIIAWFALRENCLRRKSGDAFNQELNAKNSLWRLWPRYAMFFVLAMGLFMPLVQGPFLLDHAGIKSADVMSELIAVSIVAAIPFGVGYGLLTQSFGLRAMLVLTATTLGFGNLILVLFHTIPSYIAGFAMVGIGSGTLVPCFSALIVGAAARSAHGRASGALVTVLFLGQLATPFIAGFLDVAFGTKGAFVTIGLSCGLVALLANLKGVSRN